MGQDGETDQAAQIQTLAAALDCSELGREASAWLKQQAELTEAHLRLLDKQEPPPSRKQRIFDALTRSGPIALSAGTAFVVLALLVLAAGAIWNAAHEQAVIVEALSVPQSLADRGLTGQVAASELLDRMQFMRRSGIVLAGSKLEVVPPGTPVKVEISATTITLDEVFVYLRNWLGHDIFVSGELIDFSPSADKNAPASAALTAPHYELIARVGTGACTAEGSNLEFIYSDVAGCVLRVVDPFRYATFLTHQKNGTLAPCNVFPQYSNIAARTNICHAVAIFEKIAEDGDSVDAANALATIGYLIEQPSDFVCWPIKACARPNLNAALAYEVQALKLNPASVLALGNKLEIESDLGYARDALADNTRLVSLYRSAAASDLDPIVRRRFQLAYEAGLDELRYDYKSALANRALLVDRSPLAELFQRQEDYDEDEENDHIFLPATRQAFTGPQPSKITPAPDCFPHSIDNQNLPPVAVASTADCFLRAGDYTDALSTIVHAPADCYDCLLERGVIRLAQARAAAADCADALSIVAHAPVDCHDFFLERATTRLTQARAAKDKAAFKDFIARAQWWSKKAELLAPDLPGAWFDLGKESMETEDGDGAAVAFASAHARAPHYADILEYWGVVLLDDFRDPRQAIAKFSEASIYAPRWGQLYLKWGEALAANNEFDAASEKYREARDMALAPKERAELLNRVSALSTAQHKSRT